MFLVLDGLWRRAMRWKRHLTANREIWLGLGERTSLSKLASSSGRLTARRERDERRPARE